MARILKRNAGLASQRVFRALLFGLLLHNMCVVAAHAAANEDDAMLAPYKIVRSLQSVQDSVVQGDHSAGEMQRHLLKIVDENLRSAGQEAFEDRRNVEAAFIYAMSGGNPETLVLLVERDVEERFDRRLAAALHAYFSGSPETARPVFQELLPEFADGRLGAYLMLVTANVVAARDEEEAMRLFDWARLLAPGTIIEESSLRRATHIASRTGDVDRALDNAERYVRRFLHSPYASQFVDIFVYAIVFHSENVDSDRVDYILSLMDRPRQREIYLRMARMGTIAGKEEIALLAASRAEALSGENRDVVRDLAGFYAGIARVPTGDVTEALETIAAIPDDRLSKRDRALRDAAKTIARQVMAPPDAQRLAMPVPSSEVVVPDDDGPQNDETDAPVTDTSGHVEFLTNKRATIEEIDTLLDGSSDE
ncbi:chemotaxis protein [Hoeflea poritis]|uniref:Chemotaxis protein n=1 Tax=Hoeflea poritis TaxID=2993659 RepID=A0ABT4VS45_9HYPH|nr:chemotaxis protein [Hoeflea poritis]MDA4847532.1 chemotaxis protein [Hoeflea poritis]